MAPISAGSVLPAVRQQVQLKTSDGVALHGELALPDRGPPVALLICVHPLTTHGGSMESHLFRKMSWRLPALAGVAVFRFNMRGAGEGAARSGGEFDSCRREGLDLGAAIAWCRDRDLPDPWLVGWSFGTDVVLTFGDREPVLGGILLSPPLRFSGERQLVRWAQSQRALTVLVPEFDDYLRPEEARVRFAGVPHSEVIGVPGASHLWVGERYVRIVLNEVVKVVVPAAYPLPTEWSGPMERWSDL